LASTRKNAGSIAPNRAVLATATDTGTPHSRIVAIREMAQDSILFFTQKGTRKEKELRKNPKAFTFSEKLNCHYGEEFFYDANLPELLNKHKWLAKIEMKLFWKVIAHTNIKNFTGKLSNEIIDKIISIHFDKK
jgi:Pyridoxamine 5'-phosphate oxidase